MELRALRYFVTVAEELHFGRAATRLNIVQPAVSQQVARLERELGVRLLDRSPRTVRLTDAGRRVLAAARDALAAADQVRVVAGQHTDRVRIGTATGMTGRLERGIDALRDRHPSFEVVLVDLPIEARLAALRDGELDLALARGTIAAPGVRVLPAWTEPLLAVVSTRHPAADRPVLTLADLAGSPLRLPGRMGELHDEITAALRAADVHPTLGRQVCGIEDTVVEVGADPASWTLLPADLAARAESTRVRAVPVKPEVTVSGCVIVPAGAQDPCVATAVAAFTEAVR